MYKRQAGSGGAAGGQGRSGTGDTGSSQQRPERFRCHAGQMCRRDSYYPAKQLDTLVEELQSADAIEEDIDNDVNPSSFTTL